MKECVVFATNTIFNSNPCLCSLRHITWQSVSVVGSIVKIVRGTARAQMQTYVCMSVCHLAYFVVIEAQRTASPFASFLESILASTLTTIPPSLRPFVFQRICLTLHIIDQLLQAMLSRSDSLDLLVLERLSRSSHFLVRAILCIHVEVSDVARIHATSTEELSPLCWCEVQV